MPADALGLLEQTGMPATRGNNRTPAGFSFLGGRQARGVLLEALDAEELGADRLPPFSDDVVNGGARMA